MDRDLGALLYALTRAVTAAEEPVLRTHGIEMWDYVILTRLAGAAAPAPALTAASQTRQALRRVHRICEAHAGAARTVQGCRTESATFPAARRPLTVMVIAFRTSYPPRSSRRTAPRSPREPAAVPPSVS